MNELNELFKKYLNDQCTTSEIKLLMKYFGTEEYTADLKKLIVLQLEEHQVVGDESELDIRMLDIYAALKHDIISGGINDDGKNRKVIYKKLWLRIAVAASVVGIAFGTWFYTAQYMGSSTEFGTGSLNYANDVKPGTNRATLTLADGKIVELSDAKTGVVVGEDLRYNDNTVVRYASGVQSSGSEKVEGVKKRGQSITGPISTHSIRSKEQLKVGTPRGGTYQVVLPDGTRVWLNAASELKFPGSFAGSQKRIVKLSGEGYFEVVKDKKHPFIVQTDLQSVEVLGTHFNINSYKDELSVRTTLLEGSVRVSSLLSSRSNAKDLDLVLRPNQQSVLTVGNQIKVKQANIEEVMAWKNGMIIFKDESLKNVMRSVARWYDVEVEYRTDVSDQYFGGALYRTKNISSILNYFSKTGDVKFEIQGRKVIVMRK